MPYTQIHTHMFILRQVSEKGESNQFLGKSYTVTHEVHQPEDYKRLVKEWGDEAFENLCGYIHSEDGQLYRVWSDQSTFIMTESGKTFNRLT